MMNNRHRKPSLPKKIVQIVITLFATLEIKRRKKIKGKKKTYNIKLQLNKLADQWEYLFISLPALILLIVSIFWTKHLEELFMIYFHNPELLLESFIVSLISMTAARMSYKFWNDWRERKEYNRPRPNYRSIHYESAPTLPGCRGCKNLHDRIYNGNLLVCGIHPYGKEDCPDYK